MARRYENLIDEDLDEKITKFTDALEEIALGGDVSVIVSDGRRMELTRGNTTGAQQILTLLLEEKEMRANGGVLRGRALNMRFGRA
jgi:hypothetical protein